MIRMRRVAWLCFLSGWIFAGSIFGQSLLVDNKFFKAGSDAYQKGDFGAAAAEFHTAWSLLGTEASVFVRSVVASRLIESWYRNGDKSTAVRWYRGVATLELSDEVLKWVALSMLDAGYYEEAAEFFEKLGENAPRDARRQMAIYQAHALVRNGTEERAYRLLFPNYETPQNALEAYFFAGIAQKTNRWEEGIAFCDAALDSSKQDEKFYARVVILKARCLAGAGKTLEAVNLVLDLVEHTYDILTVYLAFDVLMQISTGEERKVLAERFEKWSNDGDFPNRQLAAKYYGILIDSNPDETHLVSRLELFILQNPNHSLAHEARLMLGSLRPDLAMKLQLSEDVEDSEELKRHIDFASAVKQFQEESFVSAKETFLEMSNQLEGRPRDQALFNSAIASLYAGDDDTFDTQAKEFAKDGNVASAMHADLLFLGGLYYASKANPKAFGLLSNFIRSYPEHTSVIDAQLALAEMHLNQVPAQPAAAKEVFRELKGMDLSPTRLERLNYAEIWAELLTPGINNTLEKATAFLVQWPESKLLPEVSMLLATEFYEQRRYQAAEDAFLRVVRDFPESSHRETALFFAAKAREQNDTTQTPDATSWDEVIKSGGSLANHARHEKGINLLEQDRFDEAIRIFDEILDSPDEIENDLKQAAQCDKGYAYYMKALAFGGDPDNLSRAAEEFTKIVRDSQAPRAWRFQASVRRGKCLELLGRENVALEIYQSLTRESEENPKPQIGSFPIEENNWLYRAGFSAMEILERKQDWKSAVQIAEILAERNGTRASEAARKAERIRLRHFVWD